jgi:tryptophan synthase beta chain
MSVEGGLKYPMMVVEKLLMWRPTPLYGLMDGKVSDTPAKIYYKNEGESPRAAISPIPPLPRRITTK